MSDFARISISAAAIKNTSFQWKNLFLHFCPSLCNYVGIVHTTGGPSGFFVSSSLVQMTNINMLSCQNTAKYLPN